MTSKAKSRKRAPRGYHIEKWADGTYHVYSGDFCLAEKQTRADAVATAWQDHDILKDVIEKVNRESQK